MNKNISQNAFQSLNAFQVVQVEELQVMDNDVKSAQGYLIFNLYIWAVSNEVTLVVGLLGTK